ncbi:MAG: phosphonate metabolism transcriptional regulator PhnF, partial [Pseudomonadota bacterium]
KLPSEPALAERFDVNRLTLRAAVTALVDEGLLRREQGRGTFVERKKRLVYPISRRTRFSAGLSQQTDEATVQVLGTSREASSPHLAERLALGPGDPVMRVETLSLADKVAVFRSTSWFPADRFSTIGDDIIKTGSITKALLAHGVSDYVRHSTQIEARHATPEDCADLHLSSGAIVLNAEALNHDAGGLPIQFTISRIAADRVTLRIDSGET